MAEEQEEDEKKNVQDRESELAVDQIKLHNLILLCLCICNFILHLLISYFFHKSLKVRKYIKSNFFS